VVLLEACLSPQVMISRSSLYSSLLIYYFSLNVAQKYKALNEPYSSLYKFIQAKKKKCSL